MDNTKIQVLADENISGLEYFENISEVSKVSGRSLSAQKVKYADALLVRSVSTINKELLENSRVKFIASATSGIDHVDLDFLQANKIHFSHAPGSNANSVVQYVFASLAFLSGKHHFDWRELSVGIIGAGNVGSLLAKYLHRLGIDFVIYDPYLDPRHSLSDKFVSFEKVLQQDLITVHTPLTNEGLYPTWHLFDKAVLHSLRKDSMIINTSRGAVFDNQALNTEYGNHSWKCVLDVWENEPDIFKPLLKQVDIGTCHIAGYSYEGKEQGSVQIYKAFVDFFDIKNATAYPINTDKKVLKAPDSKSELEQINQTILMAYGIFYDHQQMLQLLEKKPAITFDQLRKKYSLRREFQYYCLDEAGFTSAAKKVLHSLGFN
jgi:erythronate-4-phosphate dehydrogenase